MRASLPIGSIVVFVVGAAAGCTAEQAKAPLNDDFTALAGKGDGFSSDLTVLGTLTNGQTSTLVSYTSSPRYRGFTFVGRAGDAIDAWVRCADGDAVAWLLDKDFNIVVQNDDSGGTPDSHLATTLTNPTSQTFYVVFREYGEHDATFRVTLKGSSDGAGDTTRSLVGVTVRPYFASDNDVLVDGLDHTHPVEFVAIGQYDDGTTADLTTSALWSSTDLGVVSFGGMLLAPNVAMWIGGVAPGSATLVATASLPQTTIGLAGVVTLTVH